MNDPTILFRTLNEIGIIAQLSQTAFERVMPSGMTMAQFTVLNHFMRLGGPQSPVKLARAFQLSRATMSSTLGRMEEKGLILVKPDARDARGKLVDLTAEGRAMHGKCLAQLQPHLARLAAGIDITELAAALPALTRLREYLDRDRDSEASAKEPID